ncbi:MAG TPA: methionine adenosyltransferase [Chthonomonas sp.]|jgi:S-adenosylmethionine synthetase|uniref:methionine adenosyltransferase n=1 Tax=Chthonomonas sp. TaxID=2282153 RepID=UPI002B4B7B4E|nr:methionine adenosyltransferase [Chthonomonas sp.]HLH79162.1 methionine adenosyltransferase [Chthonomonas sp.]
MSEFRLFTSESVTEGHPDKLADQISDAVLDALIEQDPNARVALETLLTRGLCVVAGELTTSAYVEIADVVRKTIVNVGYTDTAYGFDGHTTGVMLAIQQQSPDIAQGVDREDPNEQGAGDQGLMFGYATRETEQLMPLAITIAHDLTRQLATVRRSHPELGFRPDGKAQVTIALDEAGRPHHIDTIVVSTQHDESISQEEVKERVCNYVIGPVLQRYERYDYGNIHYFINPTGRFVIGGPQADTGVTGRKIIVDTYGGAARHGGGAFSGKDPSKVDRSAAYTARYIAKNIVAAGLADRVEIQLAYAIGVAQPVSVMLDTFGTGKIPDEQIVKRVLEKVDLRPRAMIERLQLLNPARVRYIETARNGHFGNPDFPWEQLDLAAEIA